MHARNLLLITSLCIAYSVNATDNKNSVKSELKSVTVYRSGAELSHTASSVLQPGNNELAIEGISNQLDINRIQISCPLGVTIMSIEFSNNYLLSVEVSPRLQLLQDSLEQAQKEQEGINVNVSTTNDLMEVLKANRDIKGSQLGLSVAELIKLMDYYKTKSIELQNELAAQKAKQKRIIERISRIKHQISEEEKKNTQAAGRISLQLSVASAGKADFMISYITQNAFWTPYYDIRVDDIKSPLKVVYKAKMVQTTGIDWKQVKLSLSTSLPYQWGTAPVLRAWFLGYINPVTVMERGLARNRIQAFDNEKASAQEVVVTGFGTAPLKKDNEAGPIYLVNGALMSEGEFSKISPVSIAGTEVLSAAAALAAYGSRGKNGVILVKLKDGLEDYVSMTDDELNFSFDIDLPYDVPTNGKDQTATLKEYSVEAMYKYYAVPKLDRDAYMLAEVSDWEKLNLLPGEANFIFEGTYVGKSFIDPNSTTDTLNLTLGKDKRVVVKREKMADFSSTRFLGGNKLQRITYELTVRNNKNYPVKLMLKDQYPISNSKEIEVELLEDGNASINKDLGVLTWKVQLQPGESKKIRFAYAVKYPKDKKLSLN